MCRVLATRTRSDERALWFGFIALGVAAILLEKLHCRLGTFFAFRCCLGYEATEGLPHLCALQHGRRLAESGKALCPPYIRSPAQLVGLSVMAFARRCHTTA